jgi:subtilase family serine protease
MARKRRRFLLPRVDRLEDRCLLSGSSLPPGLNPTQLRTAYGINAVDFMLDGVPYSGNGQGQTIAIVDAYHDPYVLSDLKTFDATYGLPDPQFTQITLGNTANTDDGWAGETTLDVEWSHAVAPGAKIVLVEAVDQTIPSLLAAIDVARHVPGVSAVSMSFGYPQNDVPGASAFDTYFTTPPGHQGITFIASSGDSGTTGLYGGPSWPAQSPNVLAIGGTTLVVNGPKGYLAESIWNGRRPASGASPTSLSSPTRTPGSRSTPPTRPSAAEAGGLSAARVFRHRPGRGSWRSSTRGVP